MLQKTIQLQQEEEEQVNEQTIQHFNKVCSDANKLMQDYKVQSEQLKGQISGMIGIYNQNVGQQNAVPVNKIMQITTQYEEGMKDVQHEYNTLSIQLKQQENQRDQMMGSIQECFNKLQRMEIKMKNKLHHQPNNKSQQSVKEQ